MPTSWVWISCFDQQSARSGLAHGPQVVSFLFLCEDVSFLIPLHLGLIAFFAQNFYCDDLFPWISQFTQLWKTIGKKIDFFRFPHLEFAFPLLSNLIAKTWGEQRADRQVTVRGGIKIVYPFSTTSHGKCVVLILINWKFVMFQNSEFSKFSASRC